jgi:uncharacterized membrane protein YbhN (UPF0104 family)
MKSMWRPVLRVAVSAALIAVVVASVDRRALASAFARIEATWLVPAFLLIWSTTFVSAGRWSIVIRSFGPVGDRRPSYWRLWSLYWIGQFFNQLLPSGLGGDGVRMWLVRRAGLPTGSAITSVVVDRVVALAAIVLLVAIALPFAFEGAGGRAAPVWLWGVVAGCALAIVAVTGLAKVPLPGLLPANPMMRGMRRLSTDLWKLMSRPGYLAATLGASIAVQLLGAAAVYAIAQSLGVRIGLLPCVALMPIVVLATAVPVSIAGWGVREVAMVAVLASVGVAQESALLISLLYGGIAVVISLPGGVLWLFGSRAGSDELTGPGSQLARPAPGAAE